MIHRKIASAFFLFLAIVFMANMIYVNMSVPQGDGGMLVIIPVTATCLLFEAASITIALLLWPEKRNDV